MTRSRALLALALLAVVVALVVWRFRGTAEEDPTTAKTAATGSAAVTKPARGAVDPATGVPLWLGQHGVGARKIAGVVLLDGAPVPGAVVRIASKRTMAGMVAEPKVVADAAGRFDFGPQLASSYLVVAEAPKLTAATESIDLRNPTTRSDDLHLVMHACDASIHGTVRDTSEGVIAGARISLSDGRMSTGAGSETAADGTYELCVPVGGVAVMVTADGYARLTEPVTSFGRLRRDFAMIPEAIVTGRVERESDHSAIAGAIVTLSPDDPRSMRGVTAPLTTASDADGRFHFDGAAPGRYAVTAVSDGVASLRPVQVVAQIAQPTDDLVIALFPTARITGKVVEIGSRVPVEGVTLRLMQRRDLWQRLEAVTQPDGSFVIEHVSPGEYFPYAPPYTITPDERQQITVATTDVADVMIEVEAFASVSGRVTRNGQPVDGAQVTDQQRASTKTDHEGRYTLRGLAEGSRRIYAESKRIGAFTNGPSVTLTKGEARTGVDIEMELSASIAGIVVDQNDAPVAGVSLRFSLLRGRDFGLATTADDGTFSARALSGGGDYVYEVRQGDASSLALPPVTGKRHPPVTVRDGGSQITGLRISVRRERLSIAGRVLDASGKPVVDVAVSARATEGYTQSPTATTSETGAFVIRDLPAGAYTLHANAARGDTSEANVAAGRSDVVLRLADVGGIEGTLIGFTDVSEIMVVRRDGRSANRYLPTVVGGTFRVRDIPAGEYQIIVSTPSAIDRTSVTVPPGGTATIELRPARFGIVAGTVVDKDTRAVLAGVSCELSSMSPRMRPPAITDAQGAFHFERVPSGMAHVRCASAAGSAASPVTVVADQTTRVSLELVPDKAAEPSIHIGLELERQLDDLMVKSVEPSGLAARAGLTAGDVIVKINDRPLERYVSYHVDMIEGGTYGTTVKIAIERADKPMTLTLTLPAKP